MAGAAGGGIWTSDDNGTTWTPRSDQAASLAIGAVADDPSTPDHLIAGTGEANQCGDCYPGFGILSSIDGGVTWSMQDPGGVFDGNKVAQVTIDPSNSAHMLAATTAGLFVTSDGGSSWALPTDPSYTAVGGSITAVVIDPTTPATVYIAGGAARVAKSTDGGVTWAAANSGIGAVGTAPFIALALAPSSPATLYVSVGSSNNPVGLYKTINSAGTWSVLGAAPDYTGQGYSYGSGTGQQGWYDNVLAVDPGNASHVLAGGIALVETTNGGTSWSNVNGQTFFGAGTNLLHPDQHGLAFRPDGKVWVGDDGGVFLYNPAGPTVTNVNGNLNVTQFYFGFNEVGGTLLAGSQDNASARTSSSSLSAWTGIFSGDGGPSAITPNHTATQFIEANQNLYRTTDAFATNPTNITPPTGALFTPPMVVVPNTGDPSNPTVFYGGSDLYRTPNPSAATPTWTKVTSYGQGSGAKVSALATLAFNPKIVYVGFTDGVIQMSTDAGLSFTSLATQPTAGQFTTGLSIDPTNPQAVTASFSFNDTRYFQDFPHVAQYSYTTTPGSGTWTIINGNLPSVAVSRVVYDNGALIAATDAGVYGTGAPSGGATSWSLVGTGLPAVQVQDLFVDPVSSDVYAVTHGRGAWRLPVGTGLLRVTSSPAVPTQISVDGNIADSWGLVWMKESAGSHTVCFAHVDGWTEPPCQSVTVSNGVTTTVTGNFTQRGSLRVLNNPAVVSAISVDGNPTDEYGMWTDIPTGAHTVCWGAVAGWTPPPCQNITLTTSGMTVTGNFTACGGCTGQTGVGLLRVTTSPAVPSQITIKPAAGSTYIADHWGLTWLELPAAGSPYTVCFNHAIGWTEPACETVTVNAGVTTTVQGNFTQRGFLRVLTTAGSPATVYVDGVPRNDWGMWTDIPPGSYMVCFGQAAGYANTPPCQMASVNPGVETDINGSYAGMATARDGHTATLLSTGKVLVAGGYNGGYLSSAELYDPATGSFSTTGSMATARAGQTATLLSTGKVLVAGGNNGGGYLSSAELYDPVTETWSTTGSMAGPRSGHTATLLLNGKVLAAGGDNVNGILAGAQLYNPATGTWSTTGTMVVTRDGHTATLLSSGNVLVAGGCCGANGVRSSAEIYATATGTWSTTGFMAAAREAHSATLLSNGKVLVAGGNDNSLLLASAEIYDPGTATWSTTASMAAVRNGHSATRLANGNVLVAGRWNGSSALASAELYDPATGTWSTTGSMWTTRGAHTATLLSNGKVLVAGGRDNNGIVLNSTGLYDPAPGTWS